MTAALLHLANKSAITIAEAEFPYKPPRIAIPPDRSLDKDWYVEYYIWDYTAKKLKRKRLVLAQHTEQLRLQEGKELADQILSLLKKGSYINGPKLRAALKPDTRLTEAMDTYLINLRKTAKESTYSSRRTHIRRFTKFLEQYKYQNIQVQHFTTDYAIAFGDYMNSHLKISNRTKNNNIAELVTVFNYFKKRKMISDNPFHENEKLPSTARRHTAFSPEQVQAFKEAATSDPQLWLFCQFIYYLAIRPRKELRYLKIKDIGTDTVTISQHNAKSSRKDYIRIPDVLQKEIEKYQLRSYPADFYVFGAHGFPGEKPTYKNQMYRRHRAVLEKIGLLNQDIDQYSWKHTGAIALWKATQNMQLLKDHLRHTDLASTIKYLRDLGQFTDYTEVNKFPEI